MLASVRDRKPLIKYIINFFLIEKLFTCFGAADLFNKLRGKIKEILLFAVCFSFFVEEASIIIKHFTKRILYVVLLCRNQKRKSCLKAKMNEMAAILACA